MIDEGRDARSSDEGRPQSRAFRGVLIVGATSGLGQAVARSFASAADRVHLTWAGRREAAEALAETVSSMGAEAHIHQLSLPDPDDRAPLIRRVLASAAPCDVVVNCAVANEPGLATIANAERFRRMLDANVFGTYQISAVAAQAMAATGGGCVVNVSSVLTRRYIVGAIGYVTSKTAIEALTRSFAREWGSLGVRFTAVAPGPIQDTGLLASVPRELLEEALGTRDVESQLIPPDRIAAVIRQLASAEMAAVNGDVVTVDRGETW